MGWETQIGQSGRSLVVVFPHSLVPLFTNGLWQEATPPPSVTVEDDWGDDGEDEHLWVAASQLDQAILSPAPEQVNFL